MLDWLTGRRRANGSPEYSDLRSVPDRGIPANLAYMEASESFTVQRQTIEEKLREPTRRPQQDQATLY
jgi:hypothetical protein